MVDVTQDDLNRLVERLFIDRAIDFRGYKPSSLGRRVQRRMEATKSPDMEAYMKLLDQQPDEYSKLIDSILINVTQFFRDPEAWEIIQTEVIPQIMAGKSPGDQIRMWSAGCATGAEAYSLAIALSEAVGPSLSEYEVRIYATDIDDDALATAREATYSESTLKAVPPEILEKYFVKDVRWTVNRDIRKMVIFGRHNLVTDALISRVDMVTCRNVLIYMNVDLQNRILSKFHYGLTAPGFLFLGKSESLLTTSAMFVPVNERWRIFKKESVATASCELSEQQITGVEWAFSARYQMVSMLGEGVLKHLHIGVISTDEFSIVKVVNRTAETMWGIKSAEVLGKSLFAANLPPSFQRVLNALSQVKSQGSKVRIDKLDLSSEHGCMLYVSVVLTPIYDVIGKTLGVIIVTENITDQVLLKNDLDAVNHTLDSRNNELGALNLYHDSLVNSLNIPVAVLNEDDHIIMWNPACEAFYGVKASEAIGANFVELSLPVHVSRTREKIRKLRENREVFRSQPIEYITRTGNKRKVIIEYHPLIDTQGRYRGMIFIARDAHSQPLEPAATEQ